MYGFEEFVKTLLLVLAGFLLVWVVMTLVEYILKGIALHRMAQNAGFSSPALAWVPVANSWLLGSLCDRSQYAFTGRQWHFAVLLPVMDVLGLVGGGMISGLYGVFTNSLYYGSAYDAFDYDVWSSGINLLGLVGTVVLAMGLYQLFRDYAPGREVLYLVLSVIFGHLAQAIILMTLRNKVPLSAAQNPWGGWNPPGGTPPPPPGYGPGTTGWAQPPYQTGPGTGGPGTTGWAQPPYQTGPGTGGPGTTGWAQPPYQTGPGTGGPGTTGWAQPPYQTGPGTGGPETTGWAQPPYQTGPGTGGPGTTEWAQPPYQTGPGVTGCPPPPKPEQTGEPPSEGSGYAPPFRWEEPKDPGGPTNGPDL